MQKRYSKLAVYAGELEAEDTGNPESQALNQKAQVLGAKINEETAFVNPEILALGKARIDALLPRRSRASRSTAIRSTTSCAPRAHTLDAKGEAIIAAFSLSAGASGVDLPHPHQRRHAVADGEALRRQGGEARPGRLHRVPRGRQPRRPQEGVRRLLRQVQGVRAHARHHALRQPEGRHGLREGAQVPGLAVARARRQQPAARRLRRAHQVSPTPTCRRCTATSGCARRCWACPRCATTTSIRRSCRAAASTRSTRASA